MNNTKTIVVGNDVFVYYVNPRQQVSVGKVESPSKIKHIGTKVEPIKPNTEEGTITCHALLIISKHYNS